MKRTDLQLGDIVRVDHNEFLHDGRPIVSYVCMIFEGKMFLVAFDGNCNGWKRPSGWYEMNGDELPMHTIAVYRPKWQGDIFCGDYDNEEEYERIF